MLYNGLGFLTSLPAGGLPCSFASFSLLTLRWGTGDADIKDPPPPPRLGESPVYQSMSRLSKPVVGQNIAVHAAPRASSYLVFVI